MGPRRTPASLTSKRLGLGKLPIDLLSSKVLAMTGAPTDKVVTPPKAGLDFAAIKVGSGYLIVSADPVTGVEKDIGRYAVNVSANDVATSGNRPQFAESVILLPERADEGYVEGIARQMHDTAAALGVSIVGGHTELTPGLRSPIIAVTAFSVVDRFVSSQDAEEGDAIMMTKTAGLEGTAVLTRSRYFLGRISIVDEAVAAYGTGFVRAMHDCTEGGVLGAVYEMSLASGLGFVLQEKAVPVAPRTRTLCRRLSIDPMKLIGSGSVLLSVERGKEQEVKKALRPLCRVTQIGRFEKEGRTIVRENGAEETVRTAPEDELWKVLGRAV